MNTFRAGGQQDDLTTVPQSSRRGQLASPRGRSAQRITLSCPFPLPGPSPCSPSQHFRRLWEEVRPIKSSSSVYELHIKQIDAVFLPTPCILSPLTSSWGCAFDHLPRFPLFSYWGVSAHLQGLSHPPRDTILSACHRSYFWVPRSINMPRTLGRGGLIVPLPIHLLSIHPTAACSHLASSLQHPKPSRWINWG